jgi:hypothetical protein
VGEPLITYAPRLDTTPEAEVSALAAVYKFVINCHVQKKGGPETAPIDAKGPKDVSRRTYSTR